MKKVLNALKFVWKHNKVWLLVSSIIMVIVFVATMVVTQNLFLRNTVSIIMGGDRRVLASGDPGQYQYFTTDKSDFTYYQTESELNNKATVWETARDFNEKLAEEGMVLLKNETLQSGKTSLPIAKHSRISVFGKNSVNPVYGGTGSGGGNVELTVSLYQSLESAELEVNPTLKAFYENNSASGTGRPANPDMGTSINGFATGETPMSRYTNEVKSSYSDDYKDAAVVVISRMSGEGFDLPRTMVDENGRAIPGANPGDHYLELDRNEKALLSHVCENFDNVIVVINSATSMELGFLEDGTYDIDAALWTGAPGSTGMNALGRILNGDVTPSGRLVDTYAADFMAMPSVKNFGDNATPDGNRYMLGTSGADAYFVDYEESIYVGYRYYETMAYTQERDYGDYEWYDNNVVYPFGYGKSYATFSQEVIETVPAANSNLEKDGSIEVTVRVTNTQPEGGYSGKEVVQLYYTAPYYGEIEKAHVVLGDYAKTRELAPGEHEDVTLSLDVYSMASYDYNDANGNGFRGYEVEDGTYRIRIGANAHDSWSGDNAAEIRYNVPQTIDDSNRVFGFTYDIDPVTENPVVNLFDDLSEHIEANLMSRSDFEATMPTTPTFEDRQVSGEFISSLTFVRDDENSPYYVSEENMPRQGWVPAAGETAYKLYDLIQRDPETGRIFVDYEDDKWDNVLDQVTVEEMSQLIGTGSFTTMYIESIGKPATTDPDGPTGFTNFMSDMVGGLSRPAVYDTCFYATESLIGSTWNKKLAYDMGVMVGIEGIIGNERGDGTPYSGWYAPAVNIHRTPFSGRNWEYYSEDPVLSGKMGANVVLGAKSKGVYTNIKHFVANDQETNRDSNGLITWLSEQTLREIYLKPFEIIVKEGKTTGMMSSFNRLGTTWAGGNYNLLTGVLRNEWGFKGLVITDYSLAQYMVSGNAVDQMIRAGGDIQLTQNGQPSNLRTATQISLMRRATKNILYTVAQSNAMNGMGEGVVYRYAIPMWVVILIVVNVILFVGFGVWGFLSIWFKIKKLKKEEAAEGAQTQSEVTSE